MRLRLCSDHAIADAALGSSLVAKSIARVSKQGSIVDLHVNAVITDVRTEYLEMKQTKSKSQRLRIMKSLSLSDRKHPIMSL